jgi:hypothetical protein
MEEIRKNPKKEGEPKKRIKLYLKKEDKHYLLLPI